MKIQNIFALAAVALPLSAVAQSIDFEEQDYKQLGVYDTWVESPFRTGELKGHYEVIDNHLSAYEEELGKAPNASKKILAIQRSRFGSNTFGVRIDLKESFELTPDVRYLHVMVNRPYSGRVMVIGLGKRRDRSGQSAEAEQFWAMSPVKVAANRWEDVVLPIKGNGGIDIYSLVVVPDCESPHNYTEDKVCYVDKIEINGNPSPDFVYGYYPVNFDKKLVNKRGDRYLSGVALEGSADGKQSASVSGERYFYHEINDQAFTARAGETVTPKFLYQGNWMQGFVYLDLNKNGKFNVAVGEDGSLKAGNELVSFSCYSATDKEGVNSAGKHLAGEETNVLNPPSFQIPTDLAPGFYRLRYKVDWNSLEAGGEWDEQNALVRNGGGIIDIRLNVHGEKCNVNDANRNGEVLAADGSKLVKYQTEFGKPFTIRMNPEKGFDYAGVIVKHGYNLGGDGVEHDTKQWDKIRFERKLFNDKDEFTIPAEYMDGNVEIEGLFIEQGK